MITEPEPRLNYAVMIAGLVAIILFGTTCYLFIPRPPEPRTLTPGEFAHAGEWVTTENGTKVCQLTSGLYFAMVLRSSFCDDWQPGFPPVRQAQPFPFEQGWIRTVPGRGIQIHVEDRWVP